VVNQPKKAFKVINIERIADHTNNDFGAASIWRRDNYDVVAVFVSERINNDCKISIVIVDRVKNTSMNPLESQKSVTYVGQRSCIIEKRKCSKYTKNEACSLPFIAEINKK